ncbi:sugar ABC transporter ATP-binding protein [Sphaerisporangium sp. NPDC088356]|uniref:sugar ABC transporter ATP-binding protein n=1 Tax=Sphaerisporangium sp. NPDC088356 TaxID=3154871 RepID=UPI003435CC2B
MHALTEVDFDLCAGEVHAIVGENGAGKSTLVKCLTGVEVVDDGDILVDGRVSALLSPAQAREAGVAVVHQELSLFPALSVAENLLGVGGQGGPLVSWSRLFREASTLLRRVGLDLDPRARLDQLPIGHQQLIEISRALFSGARVIVLDEPTSSLSPEEVELLFSFVHDLAKDGVAFVLVTHFLEDVMSHADRITVLRNGRRVAFVATADITKHELVELVVGDASEVLQSTYEGMSVQMLPPSTQPVVLECRLLQLPPTVQQMSLSVRRGEIVGLYGDLASGHTEAAELIFGAAGMPTGGEVLVDGVPLRPGSTTRAKAAGIGFIPADRRDALALDQPIAWNATLAHLHRLAGFILRAGPERAHLDRWTEKLGIRGVTRHKAVGALSGGNQQKVLFARWLEFPPKVLVLVEPTRGMDVGAKSDVARIVAQVAEQGTGVLVVSSEPETTLTFAQRVLVARRGRIVAEFSGVEVSKHDILKAGH